MSICSLVALHGEKPRFAQKLEPFEHARASVDEISHCDQPVYRFIEVERQKPLVELSF